MLTIFAPPAAAMYAGEQLSQYIPLYVTMLTLQESGESGEVTSVIKVPALPSLPFSHLLNQACQLENIITYSSKKSLVQFTQYTPYVKEGQTSWTYSTKICLCFWSVFYFAVLILNIVGILQTFSLLRSKCTLYTLDLIMLVGTYPTL